MFESALGEFHLKKKRKEREREAQDCKPDRFPDCGRYMLNVGSGRNTTTPEAGRERGKK